MSDNVLAAACGDHPGAPGGRAAEVLYAPAAGRRPERCAKKLGEEAVETVIAGIGQDDARLTAEAADLIYHLLVLLESRGVAFDEVLEVLERRMRHVRPRGEGRRAPSHDNARSRSIRSGHAR